MALWVHVVFSPEREWEDQSGFGYNLEIQIVNISSNARLPFSSYHIQEQNTVGDTSISFIFLANTGRSHVLPCQEQENVLSLALKGGRVRSGSLHHCNALSMSSIKSNDSFIQANSEMLFFFSSFSPGRF